MWADATFEGRGTRKHPARARQRESSRIETARPATTETTWMTLQRLGGLAGCGLGTTQMQGGGPDCGRYAIPTSFLGAFSAANEETARHREGRLLKFIVVAVAAKEEILR